MRKIFTIILLGLALGAVSCTKSESEETKHEVGILNMDMKIDLQTRAGYTKGEIYSNALVNIYKGDLSGLVRSYRYSELPSSLYLRVIDCGYRVDVLAGEAVAEVPAVATWDNKSYMGSEPFMIKAGEVTEVQVNATVNNAISHITFGSSMDASFEPGYTFTIGLDPKDPSTQLVYDASKSSAEGYFIIDDIDSPSFSWTFEGTLAKDGTPFTRSGVIKDIEAGKLYKMTLVYTTKDGDLSFELYVDLETDNYDDLIVFEPVSTGLSASAAHEIWATKATVHAEVDQTEYAGATVEFEYSSNGGSWTSTQGINNEGGSWSAEISGLEPSTTYTYRLLIGGTPVGDTMTLTTDVAPNLPNASFEYASKVSGESYYKFYDPSCGVEEGMKMFWGSGNGEGSEGVNGSASMGIEITFIDTNDKVDGKQSVLAETSSMAGFLAAGNLFTGQFAGLVGTSGGKVNFGRPWTSRPTALKIWCKYKTGKIDVIKYMPEGVTLTKNDYDRAQIKIAIGNWNYKVYGGTKDSPVHVNTTDASTFVDFYSDPSTIACGDLIIHHDGYIMNRGSKQSSSTDQWVEYTIPFDYKDMTSFPTHIVISCAASQYGDYFTGYDGSQLWLDKFELVY